MTPEDFDEDDELGELVFDPEFLKTEIAFQLKEVV